MVFSPAAKVGIATVASIIAIGAGFTWLTNFSFTKKGFEFDVVYQDVSGLLPGANVMLMGVKVGKVETVIPQERTVLVHVHVLEDNVKILKRSRYKIMSQGIIGEKTLEIFPPANKPDEVVYLTGGEQVRGDDPARIELVMDELTATFEEFKRSTDPKKLQKIFEQTAQNLLDTTETVNRLGHQAETVMADIGPTVRQIQTLVNNTDRLIVSASPAEVAATVRDIRQLSQGLLGTYARYFGTRTAQRENAAALRNLQNLTGQLEKLADTLNRTAGDPTVQADVKDTIANIRQLTGAVTQAATLPKGPQIAGFALSPRVQGVTLQTPTATGLAGNLGLKASLGDNYLFTGIEQIGEGNYLNLAVGDDTAWGRAGFHFGLIRSKIGVGIDYGLTDRVSLSGQLFDPIRPTFRLGTTYFPITDSQFGLMAQWARTVQTNENFFWAGVEWRPLQ